MIAKKLRRKLANVSDGVAIGTASVGLGILWPYCTMDWVGMRQGYVLKL